MSLDGDGRGGAGGTAAVAPATTVDAVDGEGDSRDGTGGGGAGRVGSSGAGDGLCKIRNDMVTCCGIQNFRKVLHFLSFSSALLLH